MFEVEREVNVMHVYNERNYVKYLHIHVS